MLAASVLVFVLGAVERQRIFLSVNLGLFCRGVEHEGGWIEVKKKGIDNPKVLNSFYENREIFIVDFDENLVGFTKKYGSICFFLKKIKAVGLKKTNEDNAIALSKGKGD